MPPCSEKVRAQAVSSTAQSYKHLGVTEVAQHHPGRLHPGRHKRRGRHFRIEQSETADPRSHTPVKSLYLKKGCPVFVQIQR